MASVGELTNDGKADILWHNKADGRVGLWEMDGDKMRASYLLSGSIGQD